MTDLKTSSNLSYALSPPDAVQSAIRPRSRRISPLPARPVALDQIPWP
jgi:hypothetical protein